MHLTRQPTLLMCLHGLVEKARCSTCIWLAALGLTPFPTSGKHLHSKNALPSRHQLAECRSCKALFMLSAQPALLYYFSLAVWFQQTVAEILCAGHPHCAAWHEAAPQGRHCQHWQCSFHSGALWGPVCSLCWHQGDFAPHICNLLDASHLLTFAVWQCMLLHSCYLFTCPCMIAACIPGWLLSSPCMIAACIPGWLPSSHKAKRMQDFSALQLCAIMHAASATQQTQSRCDTDSRIPIRRLHDDCMPDYVQYAGPLGVR